VREEVQEFWSDDIGGRGPDGWEANARDPYNHAPELGARVEARGFGAGQAWVSGRYVHAWNNIGRIVLDDGSVAVVSGCMSPQEAKAQRYQDAVIACVAARRALKVHDLAGLLEAIEHAGAVAPILDPTLYREKASAMEEDRRLLEAALRFVNAEVRRG
jgi:hypothetical protein